MKGACMIPGQPGWFYFIGPIRIGPGEVNTVNHVIPGQRPLRQLAQAEEVIRSEEV